MKLWEEKTIGDLGKVVTGKTPSKSQPQYWSGDELFVSPKDLEDGELYITTTESRITERALEKFSNQVLPPRSVMFTSLSFGFGKMGITSRPSLTNQQINSIIVNDKHDFRFVYYLLRSYTPFIFAFNSGIDTPIVPKSVFEKVKVLCPPLETQRKIAGILSAYDDLIENNRRRIAILERMAEEIYREWFIRMRFPGHQNTKLVKGVPEDWAETTLASICDFTMGQSPKSEFYNEVGEGLPFNQGVGTYGFRFPKRETWCSVDGRRASPSNILFSVRAPVGRLNIADCEMIIGRGLAALRHKRGLNSYLFYLLKAVFSNEDIIGNGAIFNSVGKTELARFKVFQPPNDVENRFENLAKPIDRQIELLVKHNQVLVETRKMQLGRLISGRLRVDELDIESYVPTECDSPKTQSENEELAHA